MIETSYRQIHELHEKSYSSENSQTFIDYSWDLNEETWTTNGNHYASGEGKSESSYKGYGAYFIDSETVSGAMNSGSRFLGKIEEYGESTEVWSYSVNGNIGPDSYWNLSENGNQTFNSYDNWTDTGEGESWKLYEYLEEAKESTLERLEWDMYESNETSESKGREESSQSVLYSNVYSGGLLTGGFSSVSGTTVSKNDYRNDADYMLDFGFLDPSEGTFEEYGTDLGNWNEKSNYSYDDTYSYTMIYSGDEGWILSHGNAVTKIDDESSFDDECYGRYLKNDTGDSDDTYSGTWEEGFSESYTSNRIVNSIVSSGSWIDTGNENFNENGNGYSGMTVDDSEYYRAIIGGSVHGTYGNYWRDSYDYDFSGTLTLEDSLWTLSCGTGHNHTSSAEGDSYDGFGTYETSTSVSGYNGSPNVEYVINGTIIESGRISSGGNGIRENYTVTDGSWELIGIDASLENEEIVRNIEKSRGEYSAEYASGTIEGGIEIREYDFRYEWDSGLSLDETGESLEGNAKEKTSENLENRIFATGILFSENDYYGYSGNLSEFGSSGSAPIPFSGIRTDKELSKYDYLREIEFTLEDNNGIYSWVHDKGTKTENWFRTVETEFDGSGFAERPENGNSYYWPSAAESQSYTLSSGTKRTFEANEVRELDALNSIFLDDYGHRIDAWNFTTGNNEERLEQFEKSFLHVNGTSTYVYSGISAPGSFVASDLASVSRTIIHRETFDSGLWTLEGEGTGKETILNNYSISGTGTSDSGEVEYSYTNRFSTNRDITYEYDSTTRTQSVFLTETLDPTNPFNPSISGTNYAAWNSSDGTGRIETTWNQTMNNRWTNTGTGTGAIAESWNLDFANEREYNETINEILFPLTETTTRTDAWNYEFSYTESKTATNNNWEYDSVNGEGSGAFYNHFIKSSLEESNYIRSEDAVRQLGINLSNSPHVSGIANYSLSSTENNEYTLQPKLDPLSGRITFLSEGTAVSDYIESFSYTGSLEFDNQTNAAVSIFEHANTNVHLTHTNIWHQNSGKFSGTIETTLNFSGNSNYTCEMDESISLRDRHWIMYDTAMISLENTIESKRTYENAASPFNVGSGSQLGSTNLVSFFQSGSVSGSGTNGGITHWYLENGDMYLPNYHRFLNDGSYEYSGDWTESFESADRILKRDGTTDFSSSYISHLVAVTGMSYKMFDESNDFDYVPSSSLFYSYSIYGSKAWQNNAMHLYFNFTGGSNQSSYGIWSFYGPEIASFNVPGSNTNTPYYNDQMRSSSLGVSSLPHGGTGPGSPLKRNPLKVTVQSNITTSIAVIARSKAFTWLNSLPCIVFRFHDLSEHLLSVL